MNQQALSMYRSHETFGSYAGIPSPRGLAGLSGSQMGRAFSFAPPAVEPAALVARHPGFPAARDQMIANLLQLFRGNYLAGRLLLEEGRLALFQAILCGGATVRSEDRESWLTLGRLQERFSDYEFASRNRIEAIVSVLERYGFVEKQRMEEDLRVSVLMPTVRMWDADGRMMAVQIMPLELIASALGESVEARLRPLLRGFRRTNPAIEAYPDLVSSQDGIFAPSARIADVEPRLHRQWRVRFGRHLPAFGLMRLEHSKLMKLISKDSGYFLLLHLVHEANRTGRQELSLPYDVLAACTGVSRTHARLLVELAAELGLITLLAKGGRKICLEPEIHVLMDRWVAANLAFLMQSA